MTRISSKATFVHKKLFPVLWFGFLVIFVILSVLGGAARSNPVFLLSPILMAVFGYFVMKKIVWDLADEVYDGGDFLFVRKGGVEEKIPLSQIVNVNATTFMNPPRVTLRLRQPGTLGPEITFSPAMGLRLNPFARSRVVDDLVLRVDRARSRRRG